MPPRHINRAFGVLIQQRIEKLHHMRLRTLKNLSQILDEIFIRRIIRPQGKHPTGMQLRGQPTQPVHAVKCRVPLIEQVPWRVIDIQQHRMKFSAG